MDLIKASWENQENTQNQLLSSLIALAFTHTLTDFLMIQASHGLDIIGSHDPKRIVIKTNSWVPV